jgi:hypothetical protein
MKKWRCAVTATMALQDKEDPGRTNNMSGR